MGYPTVKTLLRITDGDEAKATELRAILTSDCEWQNYSCPVKYYGKCFNRPDTWYLQMLACDTVLDTFGIEYAENPKDPARSFDYCNTGETYCPTLCCRNGRFFVAAWGDIVEKWRD